MRVMSVSKNFAMAMALVVANLPQCSSISLDTAVRLLLPDFTLREKDWNDGGSEMTLRMLASHTAGFTRESYSTSLNVIMNTGKADLDTVGAGWADASAEDVIEAAAREPLMFPPGQRAGYSNIGISLLGSAVATYYNNVTGSDLSWSQLVARQLLGPLNMTHSFFNTVPQDLEPFISIPGGDNWADLLIGEGYNPAAGMWSSANDLAKYLYGFWLSPTPDLITAYQRRDALKPVAILPDGIQQTGPGWEIQLLELNSSANASLDSTKTYSAFGKSGNGGRWSSWIDVIPNLGYGIVVLAQQSGLEGYAGIVPVSIRDLVHGILAPAFADAAANRMAERFGGMYTAGEDTGLLTDVAATSATTNTTFARIELEDHILYLRELVVNGSSALEALDRLSWVGDTGPIYFSTERGVMLEPAEGVAENAEFGEGAQVWRLTYPDLATCDWFDYDGYKDTRGWPLSKVVLIEEKDGVELRYPPFDIVVKRT